MIILEGIDCVGKTTAGELLRDRLGSWSMRHFTNPNHLGGCYRNRMSFLADAHPQCILDRFHLNDYAYEVALRGAPGMTLHGWRMMELALLAQGALTVWMTDDLERVRERWDQSREMYPFEQVVSVAGEYHRLMMELALPWRTVLPWVELDLPAFTQGAAVGQIAARAQAMAVCVRHLPPPSVGIGSPAADFVIVDEGCAPGMPPENKWGSDPDLPMSRTSAGAWMWRSMDDLDCAWWKGYYTRADAFVAEDFGFLVGRTIKPRVIVCMGPKGLRLAGAAQERGFIPKPMPIIPVFHPSYTRTLANRKYCYWRSKLAAVLNPWCDIASALDACGEMAHYTDAWDLGCSEGPGGEPVAALAVEMPVRLAEVSDDQG